LAFHYQLGGDRAKSFKYEIKSAALAVSSGAFNDGLMFAESAMNLSENAMEMGVLVQLADYAIQYLELQKSPMARKRFSSSFHEFVLGETPRVYENSMYISDKDNNNNSTSTYFGLDRSRNTSSVFNNNGDAGNASNGNGRQERRLSIKHPSLLFTESFLEGNHLSEQVIAASFKSLKQRAEELQRQMILGQPSLSTPDQESLIAAREELLRSNTFLAIASSTVAERFRRAQSTRPSSSSNTRSSGRDSSQHGCCVIV
jgi:hypothetical protein